jgi:hypothetical protein
MGNLNIKRGDFLICTSNHIEKNLKYGFVSVFKLKKGTMIKVVDCIKGDIWGTSKLNGKLIVDIDYYGVPMKYFRKATKSEIASALL